MEPDQWLLKDDLEWSRDSDTVAKVIPYLDPSLRDPVRYLRFLQELDGCALVRATKRPLGRCTPFFVPKKSGAQRLVLDCRQVNEAFREPPGMEMGTLT
eukprot:10177844-Alexandrium_andersonii.AAC.1